MSRRSIVRSSIVLGIALGGVLVGHWLTYRLVLPDAHARGAELAASSHGYLTLANRVGLIVAIVAIGVAFLGRLVRTDAGMSAASVLGSLLMFQVGAFTAMEIAERLASGGSHRLGVVLAVGVPAQVAIAAAGVLLLRVVLRVAAVVHATLAASRRSWSRDALVLPDVRVVSPRPAMLRADPPERAPPFPR
jgi:hypothetical protein